MLQTEFEFTLPKGYVDEEGRLHRQGVMRLATAADEEAVFFWALAVPPVEKWLSLLPESYREGAEAFLLPLFSAFRLLHHLLLYRKEDLLKAFEGRGD
ncbi:hypothetical protein [Thermosulfurimonas marina]|uniref:hypothetical protein n=1 Tax=Thermosulfurimonas marina TaxID=2047767 RepID=UPI001B3075E4|nr:hypothetical protein [Thermosulfurimonas marina]